jgi:hypothetical protein
MDQPIIFYNRSSGRVLGCLPVASDAVKVGAKNLDCAVEHKCLILNAQTGRTVVMHAGDAVGLDPSQFVLLQPLSFDSLRRNFFGKRDQRHVDQGQLGRLKKLAMRLAFWHA